MEADQETLKDKLYTPKEIQDQFSISIGKIANVMYQYGYDLITNKTINTMELQQIFETTKEQRVEFTHQLIERLNAGELDPLKTHLQVKALEDMLETLKANKDYKDAVLNAAVQNGKEFEYMSAKFNIREVGVKYDYTKCESPAYDEIMTEYNSSAKAKKDMEEFLKKVPHQGLDIINGVTGEVTRVYPPAKSSTTSVAVSLK
jgi:hypothetical protein